MNTKILGLLLIAGLSAMQVEAMFVARAIRAINHKEQVALLPMTKEDKIVAGYQEERRESVCCTGIGCLACVSAAALAAEEKVSAPVATGLLGMLGFWACARGACAAGRASEIRKQHPRLERRFKRVDY